MWFGAVGDGVTDDTTSIQSATNAAIAIVNSSYSSIWDYSGISVLFPHGVYYITSSILVAGANGVSFVGDGSRGAQLETDLDTIEMFVVGDPVTPANIFDIHFRYLTMVCKSNTSTTIGIRYINAINCDLDNCTINNFAQNVYCERVNTLSIKGCNFDIINGVSWRSTVKAISNLTLKGSTLGTGGNITISNTDFGGSASADLLINNILIEECDGLYMSECHFSQSNYLMHCAPTGEEGKERITDIYASNCYFDADGQPEINVWLEGSVTTGGLYQNINFSNCIFRGGISAEYGVKIEVTDLGSFYSSGARLENINFDGCTFKQASKQGLLALGDASGKLEVVGLKVTDSTFTENNSSGNIVSDLLIECDSATINDNNVPIEFSSIIGAVYQVSNNIHKGVGNQLDDIYKLTTTDAASTSIFSRLIPQRTSGSIRVTVNGSSPDAVEYASYVFEGSFNRTTGSLAWAAGDPVVTRSHKTSGVLTAPTLVAATNSINVTVAGIAATSFTWTAKIELLQSK